jgi:hypothetical protein
MVFFIGTEGNNRGSGIVNVRAVFLGHDIDFSPFSLSAIALVMSILKMPAKVKKKHFWVNDFRSKASDHMVFKSVSYQIA